MITEPEEPKFHVAGEPACFEKCVCTHCHRELCERACHLCAVQKGPAPCTYCPDYVDEEGNAR